MYDSLRTMIEWDGPVRMYAEGLVRATGGAVVFGSMALFCTHGLGAGPVLPFAVGSCVGFCAGWWHTYTAANERLDYALHNYPAVVLWHAENQMPQLFVKEQPDVWFAKMLASQSRVKREYCMSLNSAIYLSIQRAQEARLDQLLLAPPRTDTDDPAPGRRPSAP